MDISDTKQLFEIYVFISKMEIPPQQQSIDQFKITLLARLRKSGRRIQLIDEEKRLFSLNEKIILYFSPSEENISGVKRFLYHILENSDPPCIIAYGIRNETGACIYRVETPY